MIADDICWQLPNWPAGKSPILLKPICLEGSECARQMLDEANAAPLLHA